MKRNAARLFLILVPALGLYACGGGGGSTSDAGSSAGTATFTSGVITAKGSIYVNGVEWDTSGTSINVNGSSGADSDLQVGMVVSCKGTLNSNGTTGVATECKYAEDLKGKVQNKGASTFEVFGLTIKVDANTRYKGTTGFSTLNNNDVVEVSGIQDGTNNQILAKFIEVESGTEFEVKGTVSGYTGAGDTNFVVTPSNLTTGITVNVGTATLPSSFANGSYVEVKTLSTTAPITAKEIEIESKLEPSDSEKAELEGVWKVVSAGNYKVNGVTVNPGSLSLAGITDGTKVEVEGTYQGGVLVATKIEIED